MNFTPQQIKTGRRWAYATMLAMLALSIAGNISHTLHVNPDPSIRALVYAVSWPLMVWAGVELFVRVPWQAIVTHRLVRWVGILLVAAIAALVSYRHLRGLLLADGEEWTVYTFGPVAVDGLMLMATLGLLLTRNLGKTEDEETRERAAVVDTLAAQVQELLMERAALESRLDSFRSAPVQLPTPEPVQAITAEPVQQEQATAEVPPVVVPEPVKVTAPALPTMEIRPLAGWTAPPAEDVAAVAPVSPAPAGKRRVTVAWDEDKARQLLLEGKTKAEVADVVGVHAKTIQRLRSKMVAAGELTK